MVTIVIASYNCKNKISTTLDSIRHQKSNQFNLVIVDGLSSDGSKEEFERYSDIIDLLIVEKDTGIYEAWNKAIARFNSDWYMFIGLGDIILNGSLKRIENLVINHKSDSYDYVSFRNILSNGIGEALITFGKPANYNSLRLGMVAAHVGSLHSSRLLNNGFRTDYKICSDYALLLENSRGYKYGHFNTVNCMMEIGGASWTVKALVEQFHIRRNHSDLPLWKNLIILCINYFFLKFNNIRYGR